MLNVGRILESSISNGPGKRSVIWLQGCSILCRDCWNPAFLSHSVNNMMNIEEIFQKITNSSSIEGVSILGGEPFDQAEGLWELIQLIRKTNLSIMLWSGYTINYLKKQISLGERILKNIDILVDGPYIASRKKNLKWRGSENQHVYFLTNRYKHLENEINKESREFEILFRNGSVMLTGDPSEAIIQVFNDAIKNITQKERVIEQ
jgi:anaerobic ribonucleoside-triphosphate reductase activating protein